MIQTAPSRVAATLFTTITPHVVRTRLPHVVEVVLVSVHSVGVYHSMVDHPSIATVA